MFSSIETEWGPLPAGRFRVEIEGVPAGGFTACRGLGGESHHVTFQEGGSETPRLFRDGTRWEPIRLESGHVSGPALWEWFQSGDPKDGTITLLGPDGSEAVRWSFRRGRPSRWRAPELDASRRTVAVELVEIVHEGVQCVTR